MTINKQIWKFVRAIFHHKWIWCGLFIIQIRENKTLDSLEKVES